MENLQAGRVRKPCSDCDFVQGQGWICTMNCGPSTASPQTSESSRPAVEPGPFCADGGTCHHHCDAGSCFRQDGCAPLDASGLLHNWTRPPSPPAEPVELQRMADVISMALNLIGGWRKAIAELEDFTGCSVRLKNMVAALDQIDEWTPLAKKSLESQRLPRQEDGGGK